MRGLEAATPRAARRPVACAQRKMARWHGQLRIWAQQLTQAARDAPHDGADGHAGRGGCLLGSSRSWGRRRGAFPQRAFRAAWVAVARAHLHANIAVQCAHLSSTTQRLAAFRNAPQHRLQACKAVLTVGCKSAGTGPHSRVSSKSLHSEWEARAGEELCVCSNLALG